jgi:Asp-tRNA(Asn)/Glu-tRNA(Gln) amidotransferase A subunit family amidase
MDEISRLSSNEALRRMEAGELTAETLVNAFIDRILERDALIGAWAYLERDLVLRHAREIDRGTWRGKLHGIPVDIKDVIDTAEMPTEYNSP